MLIATSLLPTAVAGGCGRTVQLSSQYAPDHLNYLCMNYTRPQQFSTACPDHLPGCTYVIPVVFRLCFLKTHPSQPYASHAGWRRILTPRRRQRPFPSFDPFV